MVQLSAKSFVAFLGVAFFSGVVLGYLQETFVPFQTNYSEVKVHQTLSKTDLSNIWFVEHKPAKPKDGEYRIHRLMIDTVTGRVRDMICTYWLKLKQTTTVMIAM